MSTIIAEYIWIDGTFPTRKLRSKTKIIHGSERTTIDHMDLPMWQFDGSSTSQAEGGSSDCLLKPVRVYKDPIRSSDNAYLVLCEVMVNADMPHPSNTRDNLLTLLEYHGLNEECPRFGFEQEYTLYQGSRPLGFPSESRFPPAQGPYYCGVGADEVYGRELVEKHMAMCIKSELSIQGVNAEVMPGQWEFQMGGPNVDAVKACDDLWIGRWLLYRLGEDFGISATLDPKPVTGDWNGAGMHTNFSTKTMRESGGMSKIQSTIEKMASRVSECLAVYGAGYEMRLTGHHETCRYDEFKCGVSDRTASVRIPANVAEAGCGYLEDRRPNANADPYEVASVILECTI
jgi:glutamine synthetase